MIYPWLSSLYQQLQIRVCDNTLHHALLFVSDNDLGQSQLIDVLAKSLVCEHHNACGKCKACRLYEGNAHPDVHYVRSEKSTIGVDLIRTMGDFVHQTAQLMGNKVVVIEDIEQLTTAASNSLLKTLEEPTQNTYLLLNTNNVDVLLATLKSRCEKIRMPVPNQHQSIEWLSQQGINVANLNSLQAYGGSPIEYYQSLHNEQLNFDTLCDDLQSLLDKRSSVLSLVSKWEGCADRVGDWLYLICTQNYQQILNREHKLSAFDATFNLLELCKHYAPSLRQAGINKKLLLQDLFARYVRAQE